MKLTIEHLAAYLPYEVKCIAPAHHYGIKSLIKELDCYMLINMVNNDTSFKLTLRPLSDLTKPITHKGQTFVPIERLQSNKGFEWRPEIIHLCSYQNVQKLLSWHFDIFSLIPQGLALPIKPQDNEQE